VVVLVDSSQDFNVFAMLLNCLSYQYAVFNANPIKLLLIYRILSQWYRWYWYL